MPVNEGISLVTAWASTVEPSRPLLWRSLAEWYADVLHSAAFSFGKLANARLLGAAQEISSCLLIQPADFALNGPTLIWSGQRAHPVSTCRGKGFAPGLLGVYSDAISTRTFSQPCLVWTRFHDAGPLHSAQVPQCGASTTCFRSTFRCWTALSRFVLSVFDLSTVLFCLPAVQSKVGLQAINLLVAVLSVSGLEKGNDEDDESHEGRKWERRRLRISCRRTWHQWRWSWWPRLPFCIDCSVAAKKGSKKVFVSGNCGSTRFYTHALTVSGPNSWHT